MKLLRYGKIGKEKPGICMEGINYDVSGFIKDYDEAFFANGGLPHLAWMELQHKGMLPKVAEGVRIGAPVARPSKIICIGLNYADHAKETGATPHEIRVRRAVERCRKPGTPFQFRGADRLVQINDGGTR